MLPFLGAAASSAVLLSVFCSASCFISAFHSSLSSVLICFHCPFSSSCTMFSRSASVITFSVCLTVFSPLTSTSPLSYNLHIFSFLPFKQTHQCSSEPSFSISSFSPRSSPSSYSTSSSPSSSSSALSPCSSQISYFQSQIAVAGTPNSTTDRRGSTSNKKRMNTRQRLWCRQERQIQYKQDIKLIFPPIPASLSALQQETRCWSREML